MLQVNHLAFEFFDRPLLNDIHFQLSAGQLLHLQGENGSGKSTLLKLIAGIIFPMTGDIVFDGQPIHSDYKQYKSYICYVGHKTGISPFLSLRQNYEYDLQNKAGNTHLMAHLEQLSLTDLENTPCGQLSAGQTRRVALLRLLTTTAKLWLLDEPFVALDSASICFLKERILKHMSLGGAVILTSHQTLPFPQSQYREYCL